MFVHVLKNVQVILYEDELADSGVSLLSVKVVNLFYFIFSNFVLMMYLLRFNSSYLYLDYTSYPIHIRLSLFSESCQVAGLYCCASG